MKARPSADVNISNRTVVRVLLIVLFFGLLLTFVRSISHELELLFLAFFLALALNPAVSWIARKLRLTGRATATGIAYFIVVAVLVVFFGTVLPPLVRQTVNFVQDIPATISSLQDPNSPGGRLVQKYHLEKEVQDLARGIRDKTEHIQEPVLTTASKVGSGLIAVLTVLVLTFMMLVEGPTWIEKYWTLLTPERRKHQEKLAQQMYRVVTGYVNGQVLLAFIGAAFTLVTLLIASTLLHVSINAVALAGITVITGLIPMIGHTIGGVIVVLACLFVSAPLAIIMAVFLLVYQQIENVTFQPYIQAKYNALTPLLVFVAALLGIGFGGLLGAFVAIPLAGCLRVLSLDYLDRWQKRNLSHNLNQIDP